MIIDPFTCDPDGKVSVGYDIPSVEECSTVGMRRPTSREILVESLAAELYRRGSVWTKEQAPPRDDRDALSPEMVAEYTRQAEEILRFIHDAGYHIS